MKTHRLDITVLVDGAEIFPEDPQYEGEPIVTTTEYHVVQSLRQIGHRVTVLGVDMNLPDIVKTLSEAPPDLVFNLTEQYGGDRAFDKNIAACLELLEIPFTGTGAMGLMLCRDKRLCKQLLGLHKVHVPAFLSFPTRRRVQVSGKLHFPMVVKPALEDGSEGIANASVVSTAEALRERVEFVHARWNQPAIAEEYIPGRELYVSLLGNRRLRVLPVRECVFGATAEEGPTMLTYRAKWSDEYREKWKIDFEFAELAPAMEAKIQKIGKKVYRILHLQDYGRIDLRLRPDGRVVVLEANPNPDIAYGEEVAEAAEKAGIDYESLLQHIVRLALRRFYKNG
jgi:D-alanine-D-alanine ligase